MPWMEVLYAYLAIMGGLFVFGGICLAVCRNDWKQMVVWYKRDPDDYYRKRLAYEALIYRRVLVTYLFTPVWPLALLFWVGYLVFHGGRYVINKVRNWHTIGPIQTIQILNEQIKGEF